MLKFRNVSSNLSCFGRLANTSFYGTQNKQLSTGRPTSSDVPQKSYSLVVIGGGAGGLSVAARFARYLKALKKGPIAVIEPSSTHYYQPLWTLVGAGLKDISSSARDMAKVMPKGVDWIQDICAEIDPKNNSIRLMGASGSIKYDYLVVSAGIKLDWDRVEGLSEALEQPKTGVCSNYSARTVGRTWETLQSLNGGNALFTFPNTPVKCAGAPQKIMYLTDAYLTKTGKRQNTNISYNTALPAIFTVKHYADALVKLCKKRDIAVNYNVNLTRVDPSKKTAYFQRTDKPEEPLIEKQYDMLHVTPPMCAHKFLAPLSNEASNGFVAVDPKTLRHVQYPNIFALGDCSSLPTSKTAAAIASQNYILSRNLLSVIQNDGDGSKMSFQYDGYTSCPLVTGFDKCILAEFNYQQQPLETFPVDQSKERTLMYYMKRDVLPFVYWNAMLKGYWSGPGPYRKLIHLGMK